MDEKSDKGEGMAQKNKPDAAGQEVDYDIRDAAPSPAYLDQVLPDHIRAAQRPAE